jgi:hypothetical protein
MSFRVSQLFKAPNAARPGRDVLVALALKGTLLLAIYLLFFGPAHRPRSDASATAQAMIGAGALKDTP